MVRRRIETRVGLIIALVVTGTMPVSAQEVRRYGDSEGGETSGGGSAGGSNAGGTYYPGQPRPQGNSQESSNQSSQQATPRGESNSDDEGESESTGSYRIRLYNPDENASDDDAGESESGGETERSDSVDVSAETIENAPESIYSGIIPGRRDTVAHLASDEGDDPSRPNRLTWLGFKPGASRTRIFLQTARPSEYDLMREETSQGEGAHLVLKLPDTRLAAGNFRRRIDASYFNRNIQMIRASEEGDDLRVEIEMNRFEKPSLSTEGTYLYLDFPLSEDRQRTSQGEENARRNDE